jgi:hypothetical protein
MLIYFRQFAKIEICASVIVNMWKNFAELFQMSAASRKGGNNFVSTLQGFAKALSCPVVEFYNNLWGLGTEKE